MFYPRTRRLQAGSTRYIRAADSQSESIAGGGQAPPRLGEARNSIRLSEALAAADAAVLVERPLELGDEQVRNRRETIHEADGGINRLEGVPHSGVIIFAPIT
jgi:hypothetical protein